VLKAKAKSEAKMEAKVAKAAATTTKDTKLVTIDKAAEYFLKNVLSNPEKPATA